MLEQECQETQFAEMIFDRELQAKLRVWIAAFDLTLPS
jgi:hypothetical protein